MSEKNDENNLISENVDKNQLIESNPNDISEVPIKEDVPQINEKSGSITINKTKPIKEDIRLKKVKMIRMYIVLSIFLSISLIFLIFEHDSFLSGKFEKIFKDHKTLCLFLFIISIIVAIGLSTLISNYECLIKTHIFGILFLLILLALNNYCIIYGKHHLLKFGEFFCALGVSIGGSLGLVIISITTRVPGNILLCLFNAIFSIVIGAIICTFHKSYWEIGCSAAAFFINVFNVYSSQYKIVIFENDEKKKKKREKKEILMYSQPFELSISSLKFIIFLGSLLITFFKCCANCCCQKKEK